MNPGRMRASIYRVGVPASAVMLEATTPPEGGVFASVQSCTALPRNPFGIGPVRREASCTVEARVEIRNRRSTA